MAYLSKRNPEKITKSSRTFGAKIDLLAGPPPAPEATDSAAPPFLLDDSA